MLLEFLKEAAKLALIAVMLSDFQSAKRYHDRHAGSIGEAQAGSTTI